MFRKFEKRWLKHIDLILVDSILWQIAFCLAYVIRFGFSFPYKESYYLQISVLLLVINICIAFFAQSYDDIMRRSVAQECYSVVKHNALTIGGLLLYLYLTKQNEEMSRLFFTYLVIISFIFMWISRGVYKKVMLKSINKHPEKHHSVIILAKSKHVKKILDNLKKSGWRAAGICLVDRDAQGEELEGIPVVANLDNLLEYIKGNVVDGLLIGVKRNTEVPSNLADVCLEMGVSTHILLNQPELGGETVVNNVGDMSVLTRSVRITSARQLLVKRLFDIVAGFFGIIVTAICFVFIAPIIYIKDPGPIFFSQTRVGKNGRKFKIYKFRSMYKDAEERKKELMAQNKIADGMMFKMDDDPRIIKGIGHFIRDFSIDELPQFWNVFKGEMSFIGTRPPTVEEYEKYDYHHKVRLSIKPGITGMWQTSGRSNITDFEQVVSLDAYYIVNWSFALDLKILFKTIKVVLKKDGAS
ncbi:MAG: sugar transferase [Clostridia bacterium]|nr:sugar transferase [Clostridia bacterium]